MIAGFHAASQWTGHFDRALTSWVFEGASIGLIGLLLLLIRPDCSIPCCALDRIVRLRFHAPDASAVTYDAIAAAAFNLALGKVGALIVLTRKEPIADLVTSGIAVDGEVSQRLLEAIFR